MESRDIKFKTNLVIISLASCFASIGPPSIASALLLIDVAESFKTHIGIMSQMNTASALFGIITALILGSLSVLFDHKNLLIIGLLMICILDFLYLFVMLVAKGFFTEIENVVKE